ncbi:MAG: stage III sporulation protein AF [Hungatella sp.]
MRVLYQWVANITFYFIFITVVSNLLPNKKYEKYCRLFMGMVLILLVIQPLTASLRLEDRLAYYFESITFQNESEDLKKELLGMETQRLQQMIAQYEEAVGGDLENMASDFGFYPVRTEVTIESRSDHADFGTVTALFLLLTENPEDAKSQAPGFVHPVESVKIGQRRPTPAKEISSEGLNQLRRKVEGYYGLEAKDVEIQLEGGNG